MWGRLVACGAAVSLCYPAALAAQTAPNLPAAFMTPLGSAAGGAVAATGTTSGTDTIIANTVDGKLFGIPVP